MIVTRIYGMRVDACNWERVSITVNDDGTEMRIVSEASGTGSVRQLRQLDWMRQLGAEFVWGEPKQLPPRPTFPPNQTFEEGKIFPLEPPKPGHVERK